MATKTVKNTNFHAIEIHLMKAAEFTRRAMRLSGHASEEAQHVVMCEIAYALDKLVNPE